MNEPRIGLARFGRSFVALTSKMMTSKGPCSGPRRRQNGKEGLSTHTHSGGSREKGKRGGNARRLNQRSCLALHCLALQEGGWGVKPLEGMNEWMHAAPCRDNNVSRSGGQARRGPIPRNEAKLASLVYALQQLAPSTHACMRSPVSQSVGHKRQHRRLRRRAGKADRQSDTKTERQTDRHRDEQARRRSLGRLSRSLAGRSRNE